MNSVVNGYMCINRITILNHSLEICRKPLQFCSSGNNRVMLNNVILYMSTMERGKEYQLSIKSINELFA